MIGFLSGIVFEHSQNALILNVNGVGYEIRPSVHVLRQNLSIGQNVDLYIHSHVREDQLTLCGFKDNQERDLFRLLLSVSGIGPKTAMSILGAGTTDEIRSAIASADVSFFQSVPGIGKKSAQRVIIELKSKIGSVEELDLSDEKMENVQTLVSALRSMGITNEEAKEMIKKVDQKATIEEQIKQALKQ